MIEGDKSIKGLIKDFAGTTLAEVTVVVAIISVLSLIFYSLVVGTMRTNMLLEAENSLTSYGQQTINALKSEVAQSRRIYQNSTEHNAILGRISIPSAYPRITNSRQATVDGDATDPKSVAGTDMGNSLFFLEDRPPFKLENSSTTPPTVIYMIDLHQFNYYYLSEKNAGGLQIGSKTTFMDLIEFQSKPYANYQQMADAQNDLSSSDYSSLANALIASGIHFCIDLSASDVNNLFYEISGSSLNARSSHTIQTASAKPAILLIEGAKATGNVRYSVAFNKGSDFNIFEPVPKYSNDTSIPFGFEVIIIGASAARQVTVRLVLTAGLQRQIRALANEVTVHARSF
jgi:type II secretory pathway pseudopilin PulG